MNKRHLGIDGGSWMAVVRLRGLLRAGNTGGVRVRPWVIAGLLACAAGAVPGGPAEGGAGAADAAVEAAVVEASAPAAPALDEGIARQAFAVARNWVRRAEVPDEPLPLEVTGIAAVHVTIRQGGPMLGQSTAELTDPLRYTKDAAAAPVDLMPLLADAVKGALWEAASALQRPQDLRDEPQRFQLDVQFALAPQRVRVDRLDQLPARIDVSAHGLAMSRAGVMAWMFPGTAIAANADLRAQLNRLLAALAIPLDRLPTIGTDDGPELYRFDAIHLAELPKDRERIVSLTRGSAVRPTAALDENELASLGDQLADHLVRSQRASGQFTGTYEPSADQFSPPTAREIDWALAAYALSRRAKLPQLAESQRKRTTEAAIAALTALASQVPENAATRTESTIGVELAPTAMALLALLEAPAGAGDFQKLRMRLSTTLRAMQQPDGWFATRTIVGRVDREASLPTAALAAAALARLYDRTRDEGVLIAARGAIDAIEKRLAESDSLGAEQAMPWLAAAHFDLARLNKPAAGYDAFVASLAKMWNLQVVPWAPGATVRPDTVGGFRLGGALLDEPTWESATALAALALAPRYGRVVPDAERNNWLLRCGLGARFVHQLAVQHDDAFYIRNSEQALGGVRQSLSDNRQPLFATAMGLLAVTELRHTLDYLAGRVEIE